MNDPRFRTGLRTHLCGRVGSKDKGKEVRLCGWVNKRRDHGSLVFIDLRDFSGLVQLVFDPNSEKKAYETGKDIRNEYVIQAKGTVRKRDKDAINPSISTGDIEVLVSSVKILSSSRTLPFMLEHRHKVDENTRLRHRYIDLRTAEMQKNLRLRHRITASTRQYFNEKGFVEVETPILAKSTPEGARDFLVPSRYHHGKFYALPQSPQLFKQTLMLSGFDRVYQIVKCFRDEALRADRQLEFTQIDLEMTFVKQDDIFEVIEGLFKKLFKDIFDTSLKTPFKKMTWQQSMEDYGTDKPDLRYGLRLNDITKIFEKSSLNIFRKAAGSGGCIKCLLVRETEGISRRDLDEMVKMAQERGAGGLAWIRVDDKMKFQSPIAKFLSGGEVEALTSALSLKPGNLVLIVADRFRTACQVLGTLRTHLAGKLEIITKNDFEFVWVHDFPLFEWDEDEKRISPMHHPFTSPDPGDISLLEQDPLSVKSQAYDIVLNGHEIGGGSIRINDVELQNRIFELLKIDRKTAHENFGFLLDALSYGAPPHGGIALGMDRLVMIMGGLESIREVIAFPMTQSAAELMTGTPSKVRKELLDELSIEIVETEE